MKKYSKNIIISYRISSSYYNTIYNLQYNTIIVWVKGLVCINWNYKLWLCRRLIALWFSMWNIHQFCPFTKLQLSLPCPDKLASAVIYVLYCTAYVLSTTLSVLSAEFSWGDNMHNKDPWMFYFSSQLLIKNLLFTVTTYQYNLGSFSRHLY